MAPRQSRFLISDRNRSDSDKRSTKIWNETPIFAGRTLASGMMSGMSNPSQQWIRLTLSDPDLVKFQPVKMWLATARDRMLTVFLKSNLYTTLPLVYSDLGFHGTSAYLLMEDWEDLIRAYHMPIGSYMLACDERGMVDTCYREFMMSARQVVQKFGDSKVSKQTAELAKQPCGKNQWVSIVHAIERN